MSTPSTPLLTWLSLARISNLPTVWTNVSLGWFLSGGGWETEWGWLLAGISLLYIAGMTLNDACDASWDALHATFRPIPSGKVSRLAVWVVGSLQFLAGAALLAVFTTAHPVTLVALCSCILIYNFLHKKWQGSVLFMGLCRALVYISAGSAVAHHTSTLQVPNSVYLAAFVALTYIVGVTLCARHEHQATASSPLPLHRVLLMAPLALPIIGVCMIPWHSQKWLLLTFGLASILLWLTMVLRQFRSKVPLGVASSLAGIAIYDASLVVFADFRAAIVCWICFFLTLVAQRFVPAT